MRSFLTDVFLVVVCTAHSTNAQTIVVDAQSNIFGAGHATPPEPAGGGAGLLPLEVAIAPGTVAIVFTDATGIVSCCGGDPSNGPEGFASPTDILSWDGIAGIQANSSMFLVGVFLSDAEPTDPAPVRLDFSDNTDFPVFSPELHQVFFVGDGLTDTGGGLQQRFIPPAGTTRLFLGFADAFYFMDLPGFYGDDIGELTLSVSACLLMGDVDGSGTVDGGDIAGFVRVKLGDPDPTDIEACAHYGTGTLEGDISSFVADLLN